MYRTNLTSCQAIANAIIQDFGNLVYPPTFSSSLYEATLTTVEDQAWRLYVKGTANTLELCVGTSIQYPDDGTHLALNTDITLAGYLGTNSLKFFDRSSYVGSERLSYPVSYYLYKDTNGFVLAIWEQNTTNCSWVLVQRPVNSTGVPNTLGYAPVHCVYSINRQTYLCNRFVVRESDILVPSISVDATTDTQDMNRIINKQRQVSITENNAYMLSFIKDINTQRHVYPGLFLDLMCYSGADVITEGSNIPTSFFGSPRTYFALPSNGANNTGVRMLMRIQ